MIKIAYRENDENKEELFAEEKDADRLLSELMLRRSIYGDVGQIEKWKLETKIKW